MRYQTSVPCCCYSCKPSLNHTHYTSHLPPPPSSPLPYILAQPLTTPTNHIYNTNYDSSLCPIQYDPLLQPALLRHEVRSSPESQRTIASARFAAARILAGHDDRVLVIVGPCSIHSPEQAIEYAKLLKEKIPTWGNLLIVMRAYL